MKSLKHITYAIIFLSMTMGSILPMTGQVSLQFVETYKSIEITTLLDQEDRFFLLVNTGLTDPENAALGTCPDSSAEALWAHLHSEAIQNRFPWDLRFAWGWRSDSGSRTIFVLKETKDRIAPEMKHIQSVAIIDGEKKGTSDLLITFSDEGAKSWAAMTKENVGRSIAIVVDGRVVTAPRVMTKIKQGKCRISGNFSIKEASEIKRFLEI